MEAMEAMVRQSKSRVTESPANVTFTPRSLNTKSDSGKASDKTTADDAASQKTPELGIDKLFNIDRFSNDWRLVLLIMYFPLGLALIFIRLFLLLHLAVVSVVIPKSFHTFRSIILRFLSAPIGIVISISGKENISRSCKLIVCNRVTVLDRLVVNLVIPNILITSKHSHPFVCWLFGLHYIDGSLDKSTYCNTLKETVTNSDYSILCQPEPCITSGRVGMLKFTPSLSANTTALFSLDLPTQPVIIQTHRSPIGYTECSTLDSSFWADIFWTLFSPTTHYFIRVLPVMSKPGGGDSDTVSQSSAAASEFSEAVRQMMCTTSGLVPTHYHMDDVKAYRIKLQQQATESCGRRIRPVVNRMSGSQSHVQKWDDMVARVREILPTVPEDVIRIDLARTKSTNSTISRLLDGTVTYTPLQLSNTSSTTSTLPSDTDILRLSSSSGSAGPSLSPGSTSDVNVSSQAAQKPARAVKFSSNPSERAEAFGQRKEALISDARQRYLRKHGKYWMPPAS